jgi:hypothetical protein
MSLSTSFFIVEWNEILFEGRINVSKYSTEGRHQVTLTALEELVPQDLEMGFGLHSEIRRRLYLRIFSAFNILIRSLLIKIIGP